jgi:serine/threonine-protein kinase
MPIDGSAQPELVYDHPRGVDEAASSAGDEWAIVRVGSGGGRDIYGRRAGTDELVPLIATEAEEFSPAPSPDGRWLAYGSDETGKSEVYVRPFPGTSGGRWKVSLDGGTEPVWSNDGRELYYRSGAGDLMAAEIAPGPEFRIVVRRRLFRIREYVSDTRNRAYSIGPDGSFYFIAAFPGQQSRLMVVQNWLEELKTRVP